MQSSKQNNFPKYIFTPQSVVETQPYGDGSNGHWLNQALALNVALMTAVPTMKALADHLIPEISKRVKAGGKLTGIDKGKGRDKFKQSVKVFLLNVYTAYLMGVPVYYPRDANAYTKNSKYGEKFFTFDRVVPIADALIAAGYFEHRMGYHYPVKKKMRRSRVWASDKLLDLFQKYLLSEFQISERLERKQLIELRDEDKNSIKYSRTARTIKMEKKLRFYNDFIDKSNITVVLNQSIPFSLKNLKTYILSASLSGNIKITNLEVIKNNISNVYRTSKDNTPYPFTHKQSWIDSSINWLHTKMKKLKYDPMSFSSTASTTSEDQTNTNISQIDNAVNELHFRKRYDFEPVPIVSTATITRQDPAISLATLSLIIRKHRFLNSTEKYGKKIEDEDLIKSRNNAKHPLQYYGIQQVAFTIEQKQLYRVFNLKKFTLGGRFYGAYHERLPEESRAQITIDGQKTVELDYSAHHLRMSYHLEGIDYEGDPYLALTGDHKERKTFKSLCFVVINAPNEGEAIKGFRRANISKFKEIDITDDGIRDLLDRVKKVHHRIAAYVHSEKGRTLQFLDSQITEAILMRMTEQNIPCLPVHDSYIVPIQYEELLREVMMNEYKKLMGFVPVID